MYIYIYVCIYVDALKIVAAAAAESRGTDQLTAAADGADLALTWSSSASNNSY